MFFILPVAVFVLDVFAPALLIVAGFVLAVFVLAVFVLSYSSPNGRAKVEASPNGGATGSESKSQAPYVFPLRGFALQRGQG